MNDIKVIKWTFADDPQYPESDYKDAELDRCYETAIVECLREHGYKFDGVVHQRSRFGTPVMSDGVKYTCTLRQWGSLMAEARENEGFWAYTEWAWSNPIEFDRVLPDPYDWYDNEEDLVAQELRWKQSLSKKIR